MAGKKEHLRSLYLCVSCCVVRLSPVFPPQHRLQPLACKPVRKKDASSQVPGFCLKCEREMQEMKSPPSLPRPVSAADFEQHWVTAKDIRNSLKPKKPLPASQRGFPATSLVCSASGIQWLAQIYLFICFIHLCFVWKRLICLSSRGSGLSFSSCQIQGPPVLPACLEEEPWLSLVRLAGSQLLGGDRTCQERDAVPQLRGEMPGGRCGVWHPAKGCGAEAAPGTWL